MPRDIAGRTQRSALYQGFAIVEKKEMSYRPPQMKLSWVFESNWIRNQAVYLSTYLKSIMEASGCLVASSAVQQQSEKGEKSGEGGGGDRQGKEVLFFALPW